jgi:hypothetical protein
MSITGDGAAVATGVFDGALATTAIGIANSTAGTLQLRGTIKNVRLWTTKLSDGQLQGITA